MLFLTRAERAKASDLLIGIKGRPMRSCQAAALSSRLQLAAQAPSLGNLNNYLSLLQLTFTTAHQVQRHSYSHTLRCSNMQELNSGPGSGPAVETCQLKHVAQSALHMLCLAPTNTHTQPHVPCPPNESSLLS